MNLNLFIIGSSLASALQTLIIPINEYIIVITFSIVLNSVVRNGRIHNINEFRSVINNVRMI